MTMKLLTSGVFAGLLAGLIAVLLQFLLMEPIILEAELYETGERIHAPFATALDADAEHKHDDSHEHGDAHDAGDSNIIRYALAFSADFIVYVGWGLLMVAGFAVAAKFGHSITRQDGILWGIAGFIAIHLAPGIGLTPELPGVPAADLAARQLWWIATAIAAVLALAMIFYGRSLVFVLAGLALLAIPHIIGAPHLPEFMGKAPPELSGEFVARSFAVALSAWGVLGLAASILWNRNTAS